MGLVVVLTLNIKNEKIVVSSEILILYFHLKLIIKIIVTSIG